MNLTLKATDLSVHTVDGGGVRDVQAFTSSGRNIVSIRVAEADGSELTLFVSADQARDLAERLIAATTAAFPVYEPTDEGEVII